MNARPTAADLDALLPQTQCTRCGYEGCLPYAQAIAAGDAPPNRCPPGGEATRDALAAALGIEPPPLDESCGPASVDRVAVIDEARCIGCAKCLPPCPVDAIVGTGRHMHTVVASLCTGCELCLPPCPVDCIVMIDRPVAAPPAPDADENRRAYTERNERLTERAAQRAALIESRKRAAQRA